MFRVFFIFLAYVSRDSKKNNCRKKIPGKVRMKYIFFQIIICLSMNNLSKFYSLEFSVAHAKKISTNLERIHVFEKNQKHKSRKHKMKNLSEEII